jgi:hypothetical protein
MDQWDATLNAFVKTTKKIKTYNSYGQCTSLKINSWDTLSNSWTIKPWDTKQNFYYEEYTTGISTSPKTEIINIYPNPAKDQLIIKLGSNTGTDSKISLYNNLGVQVLNINQLQGTEMKINVQDLSSGTYFLHVEVGNSSVVKTVGVIH